MGGSKGGLDKYGSRGINGVELEGEQRPEEKSSHGSKDKDREGSSVRVGVVS